MIPLPEHISNDGREIWDWADRFSKLTHARHKVGQLTADLARVGTRCGDCDKWMKSRECPRERNVNGQTRGPSCEGLTCGQFVEARSATQRGERLTAELAVARADLEALS